MQLDNKSIDYSKSKFFEIHRIFCTKNIPFFEIVVNLEKLPPTGAFVVALPMKINGGNGSTITFCCDHSMTIAKNEN